MTPCVSYPVHPVNPCQNVSFLSACGIAARVAGHDIAASGDGNGFKNELPRKNAKDTKKERIPHDLCHERRARRRIFPAKITIWNSLCSLRFFCGNPLIAFGRFPSRLRNNPAVCLEYLEHLRIALEVELRYQQAAVRIG